MVLKLHYYLKNLDLKKTQKVDCAFLQRMSKREKKLSFLTFCRFSREFIAKYMRYVLRFQTFENCKKFQPKIPRTNRKCKNFGMQLTSKKINFQVVLHSFYYPITQQIEAAIRIAIYT